MTSRFVRLSSTAMTVAVVLAALLSGCMSMSGAVAALAGGGSSGNSTQTAQEAQSTDKSSAPSTSQGPSAEATMAAQYQFNAFYSGFWTVGWYGEQGANYEPGQGTVWQFTGEQGGSSKPVTFERALLKVNSDNSQWWHFKVVSDNGKAVVYEFLVGPDKLVKKVRYRDPDSNAVGEFVPSQSNQQKPNVAPMNREEMAKYVTGKESITVKAGTFTADHILYTDDNHNFRVEAWGSDKVPGGLIKSIATNLANNQKSVAELIQIESGVTTELGSY